MSTAALPHSVQSFLLLSVELQTSTLPTGQVRQQGLSGRSGRSGLSGLLLPLHLFLPLLLLHLSGLLLRFLLLRLSDPLLPLLLLRLSGLLPLLLPLRLLLPLLRLRL